VVLVTDSVAWRRGQVGTIELVHDGRAPRLPDGTLAGSALALDQAVANVVATCGVALEHAIDAASANPARLLGLDDRGAIVEGRRADLVALDPDTLRATATWIGGEQAHGSS
jgi:N-acetylglucosamine-6-phosphate deacetylase